MGTPKLKPLGYVSFWNSIVCARLCPWRHWVLLNYRWARRQESIGCGICPRAEHATGRVLSKFRHDPLLYKSFLQNTEVAMSESSWVGLNLSGSSKWSISRQNAARRERQSWCINRIHPSTVLQRLSLLPGLHFTERVEAGLGIRVLHVVPGQVRPWDHELMWYVYRICIWLNLIMTWAYLHFCRNVAILWGVGSWFRTSHAPLQVAVNATGRSLTLRPARSRSGPSWENLQWNSELGTKKRNKSTTAKRLCSRARVDTSEKHVRMLRCVKINQIQ